MPQITTLELLNNHLGHSSQVGAYSLTLEENERPVGTVTFFVRMDSDGNISVDHNFNFEGNRVRAIAD